MAIFASAPCFFVYSDYNYNVTKHKIQQDARR